MIDAIDDLLQANWQDWLGDIPQQAIEWVLFTNGGAFAHDNVILFGMPDGAPEPLLVAKVCRSPLHGQTLQTEYDHLQLLQSMLDVNTRALLPRPLALARKGADKALVTDFIAGESLLFTARKVLNHDDIPSLTSWMISALQAMNLIHKKACTIITSSSHEREELEQKLVLFRSLFDLSADEDQALKQIEEASNYPDKSKIVNTLIQGDFWYGNVIKRHSTAQLAIIDWQFSRQSSDVSLDVYLYLLAAALISASSSPPENRPKHVLEILSRWQSSLIIDYLQSYECPEGIHLLPLYEGMLMCCVEMATRPTFAFGTSHPDDKIWRGIFGELVKHFVG